LHQWSHILYIDVNVEYTENGSMTTTQADLLALADTLRKALGGDANAALPDASWRDRWPALAEVGAAAFCVAEDCDGFGNEAQAALVAARELGAALHGAPYAGLTAASYALSRWLPGEHRHALTAEVLAGRHVPALAFLGPGASVTDDGAGLRVSGVARLVAGAVAADSFLLLPPESDAMLYVAASAECEPSRVHEFDTTRSCCDVAFTGTRAVPLTSEPGARSRTERLRGLLLTGDTLGGLSRMLDRAVGYAKERTTFGRAIGGYQAVQHRLVDHTLALRGMSLLADEAAAQVTADAPDAARYTLLAEAAVAAGGVPLLHDLVQLTGGIGFTWEYGLHHYERRAHLNARLGGNPRRARRTLAKQEGWASSLLCGICSDGRAIGRTDERSTDAAFCGRPCGNQRPAGALLPDA
jgi:alkylation response protein AidB-like acyl-CoA dehydrogenase